MLKNEEKRSQIDWEDMFRTMLRELPWSKLLAFLQSNTQVHKRCTLGGHRLEQKRRARFEKVILQEARKQNFEGTVTSGVFAQWYPVHEQLHNALETYFHSDDYKAYREENDIAEDTYVLSDENFEAFFSPKDIQKWRVLLCFSPLEFSDEQADRILNESSENTDLAQELTDLQEELAAQKQEKNRRAVENNELRSRLEDLREEVNELREERKRLRAENRELTNKFEAARTDAGNLKKALEAKSDELREKQAAAESHLQQRVQSLSKDLQQVQASVKEWEEKYEKQRNLYRQATEQKEQLERELAKERAMHKATQQKVDQANRFANAVLTNIDWRTIGSNLKLTPQLKRKLNSLVKKLHYEDYKSMAVDDTLESFWSRLQEQEKQLVDAVAESDTREVQNGQIQDYWDNLKDSFEDVYIGLEARSILLKLMQEVFYQTFDLEILEKNEVLETVMQRRRE